MSTKEHFMQFFGKFWKFIIVIGLWAKSFWLMSKTFLIIPHKFNTLAIRDIQFNLPLKLLQTIVKLVGDLNDSLSSWLSHNWQMSGEKSLHTRLIIFFFVIYYDVKSQVIIQLLGHTLIGMWSYSLYYDKLKLIDVCIGVSPRIEQFWSVV